MTLVLLPGLDGTGNLFESFIAVLGSRFDVKVVRYPTTEPMDYAQLESIARAALPPNDSYVILGESFSGPIAVCVAASRPSQLKGLILSCSFVKNPRPELSVLKSVIGSFPAVRAPRALLSYFLFGSFSNDALHSALAHPVAQVSPSVLFARLRAVLSVDVSRKMSEVSVPVLYLRASRDRVVPPSSSHLVSRLLPQTRVVEIDGPHCLLQARADAAADVVCAFAEEVKKN